MFYVLLIAALIAILALAVTNVRLRNRAEELVGLFERSTADVERANQEMAVAQERTAELEAARDEAVERVQRARKDASEVANRLKEESKARAKAEKSLKNATGTLDRAATDAGSDRAERDAARADLVAARTEIASLTTEIEGVRRTIASNQAGASAAEAELAALRDELVDAQAAAEQGAAAGDAIEERDAARRERDELRAAAGDAIEERDAAQRERDEMRAAVEAITGQRDRAVDEAALARAALAAPEPAAPVVAESAAPGSEPGAIDLDVVWALTLARVDRTWRVSVAAGDSMSSPLADDAAQLRAAVEIEVDAAREEVGADIETEWAGPGMVPVGAAITSFAVISNLIASVAKDAARAVLHVSVTDAAIDVEVTAADDGGTPLAVGGPAGLQTGPGQFRISF